MYIYSRKTFHFIFTEHFNIVNIFSCIAALKGVYKVQKKFKVSIKSKLFKENHIAYYGIVALFSVMVASEFSLLFFWFGLYKKTLSELMFHPISISLFWNTYNIFLIAFFIRYLNSYNKKPRNEHQFHTHFPAQIAPLDLSCTIQKLSLRGAELLLNSFPGKRFNLNVNFHSTPLSLPCEIVALRRQRSGKRKITVVFKDISIEQKKLLIQYFFTVLVPDLFSKDFANQKEVTSKKVSWITSPVRIKKFSHSPLTMDSLPVLIEKNNQSQLSN